MTGSAHDERVAARLRALPELAPRDGLWPRVTAAAAAARRRRARHRAVAALAAGLALAAVGLGLVLRAPEPTTRVAGEAVTLERGAVEAIVAEPVAYDTLVAESARLERLLHELPRRGHVMSAATAGTIVGLEDRVAVIDERLMIAAAVGAQPAYRHALWRERVDVMNALVQVRYAQAQTAGF